MLGSIHNVEKVPMRVTKLINALKKLPYKQRLTHLNLPTLKYTTLRGVEILTIDVREVAPIQDGYRQIDTQIEPNYLITYYQCYYKRQ